MQYSWCWGRGVQALVLLMCWHVQVRTQWLLLLQSCSWRQLWDTFIAGILYNTLQQHITAARRCPAGCHTTTIQVQRQIPGLNLTLWLLLLLCIGYTLGLLCYQLLSSSTVLPGYQPWWMLYQDCHYHTASDGGVCGICGVCGTPGVCGACGVCGTCGTSGVCGTWNIIDQCQQCNMKVNSAICKVS